MLTIILYGELMKSDRDTCNGWARCRGLELKNHFFLRFSRYCKATSRPQGDNLAKLLRQWQGGSVFPDMCKVTRGSRRSLTCHGSGSQVCAPTRLGLETDPSRSAIIGRGLIFFDHWCNYCLRTAGVDVGAHAFKANGPRIESRLA